MSNNKVFNANVTAADHYGAIAGFNDYGTLTNNYYRACTINGTANATGVGCNKADVSTNDGALSLHTISTPNTVTIVTTPTLTYNTVDYWAQSKSVTLSGGLDGQPTAGWQKAYFVNNVANTSDPFTPSNTFTITPARDIEITIGEIHGDWANEYNNPTAGSSSDNPYKIYFTDQLDLLATRVNDGTHYIDSYFKLMNDLTYSYNGLGSDESNYTPIGFDETHSFQGHFDGNNKFVSGIRIRKTGTGDDACNLGLLGFIKEAEVKDVTIKDSEIIGHQCLGGVVGLSLSSTVSGCHVWYTVSIILTNNNSNTAGGIVGRNHIYSTSTVTNCTSEVHIQTNTNSQCYNIGGIVGLNESVVSNNFVMLAQIGSGSHLGAIVGFCDYDYALSNNYYRDCVVNNTSTNVGCDGADVTDNDGARPVFTLSVPDNVSFNATATVTYKTANYYKEGVFVSLNGGLNGTPVNPGAQLTYYVYGAALLSSYMIPTNTFYMQASDAVVTVDEAPADWAAEEGAGDAEENPYKIYYTEQLDLLATRVNSGTDYAGKYFKLMNNLTYDNTKQNNYTAIGNSQAHPFKGHFDGNNKTISGIRIYKSGDSYGDQWQAVFGYLNDSTSEVKNLTVADADITAFNFVGGIVGFLDGGTITNCHATSTVFIRAVAANANSHGGIVGDATAYNTVSEISHCTSSVTLTNTSSGNVKYYGAIAGAIRSGVTMSDNFAIGATVPSCAENDHGALVGYNNGATLARNYYHNCTVAGIANVTNKGCHNANVVDNDGAMPVFTLSLASGISADVDTTLTQNEVDYYILGTTVTLSCTTPAPAGYCYVFSVNGTSIAGNTFDMEANSNVSVGTEIIDWTNAYSGTACDPYLIGNATQWNALAASVNSGTNYNNAFFKLTADISINTIIGDYTNNDGDHYYPFSGTFDGNGHTLNISLSHLSGQPSKYVAPFACISGATIKNLHITGYVSTNGQRPASITSFVVENSTITNCWSEVDISSSYDKDIDAGGLVARVNKNKTVTITDCLFSGSITYTEPNNKGYEGGGMVGWTQDGATATLKNCLFAPTTITVKSDDDSYIFVSGERDHVSITNCYYNDVANESNLKKEGTNASNVSSTILRDILGDGWEIKNLKVVPIITPYTFSGEGTEESPYIIASETDWNGLANNVYLGEIHSCDHFKMSNDISVTTMVGSHPDENTYISFDGTFDGDGHILTVTYSGSGDCTAPFTCISGATIKNLHITGTIATTGMRPASIASFVADNSTISNCWSEVAISSSHNDDIDAGGFVARVNENKTITLNGCVFTGSITYSNNGYEGGGMVGYTQSGATATLNNCLFAPSAISITNYNTSNDWTKHYMFVGGRVRGTCNNCYYNDVAAATNMVKEGKRAYSITSGTGVSFENAGDPTPYSVSGITSYGTGIKYNDVLYAGNGESVSLNFTVPFGYAIDTVTYTPEGGTATEITPDANDVYSFTMPDANVTIDASLSPIDCWDGEGIEEDPYLIYTAEQWDHLATRVQGGTNYSGKYFKLMDDISVTTMVGNKEGDVPNCFSGTFDGNGKTLTVNITNPAQQGWEDASIQGWAPFHYISGATIKNLVVMGTVKSIGHYTSGLVGFAWSGVNTIENCWVKANLNTSYYNNQRGDYAGGIVGHGKSATIIIRGCVYSGAINFLGHYGPSGGLLGWCDSGATITIDHCLFNGSYSDYAPYPKFHPVGCSNRPEECTRNISNTYYTVSPYNMTDNHDHSLVKGLEYQGQQVVNDGMTAVGDATTTYSHSGLVFYVNGVQQDSTFYHNPNIMAREVAGYGDGDGKWAFIASPVEGSIPVADVDNLLGTMISPDPHLFDFDLYRLNPLADLEWENYHQHYNDIDTPFNALINGQGYLYATKETKTLAFSGTFNTGTSKDVTGLPAGFNLVGNPFTVDAYVNKSYYTLNSDGSAIVAKDSNEDQKIAPCYGVIVEVDGSETVRFNTTGEFSAGPNIGGLNVALTQANTRSNAVMDNVIVSFNEGSQLGKFYFGQQDANIYIPQDGKDYAITFSEGQGEMPLNFKAQENGTYTITVNPENVEMSYLHLIDNLTGADVNLMATPEYTFNANTTDYASRFRLVFSVNGASTGSEFFAFISNGQLIVNGEGILQVFDVLGHQLFAKELSTSHSSLPTPHFSAAGVYVLRLINGDDVKTQKIVVK